MKRKKSQLELRIPKPKYKWGGSRPGAGRKPSSFTRGLPHRARPFREAEEPVHITWRVQSYLPNLRRFTIAAAIGEAIRASMQAHEKRGTSFRVIHFSITPAQTVPRAARPNPGAPEPRPPGPHSPPSGAALGREKDVGMRPMRGGSPA